MWPMWPPMPYSCSCIGGGGAASAVCDRAMAEANSTARAAINKRERISLIRELLRKGFLGTRDVAYTHKNTAPGEMAVKSRSTRVKFCQPHNSCFVIPSKARNLLFLGAGKSPDSSRCSE